MFVNLYLTESIRVYRPVTSPDNKIVVTVNTPSDTVQQYVEVIAKWRPEGVYFEYGTIKRPRKRVIHCIQLFDTTDDVAVEYGMSIQQALLKFPDWAPTVR